MGTVQSAHDAWSGTVRRLEDGFFIERARLPGPGGLDFSKRVVDGIGSTTQFFCVHVEDHDVLAAPEDIWMVCTALSTGHRPPSPDEKPLQAAELAPVRASLVAALPHVRFCFTTLDREGYVQVLCDHGRAPPIAAAVAVVQVLLHYLGPRRLRSGSLRSRPCPANRGGRCRCQVLCRVGRVGSR
jgi:hypothetical protein